MFLGSEEEELLYRNMEGSLRSFEAGQILLESHEAGRYLGLLVEGIAKSTFVNQDGRGRTLSFFKPLSLFGETSLFMGNHAIPEILVTSLTPVKVVYIHKEEVEKQIDHNPKIAMVLIKALAQKAASIMNRLNSASFQDSLGLICEALLALEESGREIRMTHEEIAEFVGRNRVTVSRLLSKLKHAEMIDQKKGAIIVKEPDMLKRIVLGEFDLIK